MCIAARRLGAARRNRRVVTVREAVGIGTVHGWGLGLLLLRLCATDSDDGHSIGSGIERRLVGETARFAPSATAVEEVATDASAHVLRGKRHSVDVAVLRTSVLMLLGMMPEGRGWCVEAACRSRCVHHFRCTVHHPRFEN